MTVLGEHLGRGLIDHELGRLNVAPLALHVLSVGCFVVGALERPELPYGAAILAGVLLLAAGQVVLAIKGVHRRTILLYYAMNDVAGELRQVNNRLATISGRLATER